VRESQQFRNCLVEGDPAVMLLARRNRIVSLGLSVVVQTLLLGVALIVPLVVTAERPRVTVLTPIPPYSGTRAKQPQPAGPRDVKIKPGPRRSIFQDGVLYQPPHIPGKIGRVNDANEAQAPPGWLPGLPGEPNSLRPPIEGLERRGWSPPMPAPPKSSAPMRVSEGVQEARLLNRVTPAYPMLARQARMEGTVVLRAIIGRDGIVREVELVSGPPLFVREAIEAVREWRYQPTLLNGEPVEVETHITVIFRLQR